MRFELLATLFIELRPVAALSTRRNALCMATIGEAFERRVYPTETQAFLDDLQIRDEGILVGLVSVTHNPCVAGCPMVFLQPLTQFPAVAKFKKRVYFHIVILPIYATRQP